MKGWLLFERMMNDPWPQIEAYCNQWQPYAGSTCLGKLP